VKKDYKIVQLNRKELNFGIYALLGFYPASNRNSAPKFRNNLSVPSSKAKESKKTPLGAEAKNAKNCTSTTRNVFTAISILNTRLYLAKLVVR